MKYHVSYATQYGGNLMLHEAVLTVADGGPFTEATLHEFRRSYGHLHQTPVTIIALTKLETP